MRELRAEAEARLAAIRQAEMPLRPADELLHELRVHQIELEMQNEELRRAQVALEESRDRYVDLYEFAPVGYLTLTDCGLIAAINLTGAALLGADRKQLINRRFGTLVAPEDGDRWYRQFLHVLQHSGGLSCEVALRRGDGSRFDARLDLLHTAVAGAAPVVRLTLADISERRATAAALEDREERLRLLFSHSPIGMLMVARDFRLSDVNDVLCRLLGHTAEELKAMNFLDITHPDDRAADLDCANDMLAGRISHFTVEKRYLHKDGHAIWVRVTRAVIRDDQGEVRYGLGLVEDITERREAERRRIEDIERQRDALVREVHHRIKNNLQGVIGLIEQIKRKQPAAADALEEAAGQISAIAVVHGLHGSTLASEVRPRELVRAIVNSVAHLSDAAIDYRESHDSPEREWRLDSRDAVSIALIVNELIHNAIKHGAVDPAGGIEVRQESRGEAFDIRVFNPWGALPPGFDFDAGIGLGTGLTLVASLLPRQGTRLTIGQRADGVEAHLRLTSPCAIATAAGDNPAGVAQ